MNNKNKTKILIVAFFVVYIVFVSMFIYSFILINDKQNDCAIYHDNDTWLIIKDNIFDSCELGD